VPGKVIQLSRRHAGFTCLLYRLRREEEERLCAVVFFWRLVWGENAAFAGVFEGGFGKNGVQNVVN
jgi:hypothetical protein